MNENGEVREMQYLSDEEKAVVNAMRKGAKIRVHIHKMKAVEEVDDIMNLFSRFEAIDSSISEEKIKGRYGGRRYISFSKHFKKLEVNCFLDLDEKNG